MTEEEAKELARKSIDTFFDLIAPLAEKHPEIYKRAHIAIANAAIHCFGMNEIERHRPELRKDS